MACGCLLLLENSIKEAQKAEHKEDQGETDDSGVDLLLS